MSQHQVVIRIHGGPTTGLDDATASNPTANPSSTTTYTVTKTTTANGCTATDDVVVTGKYDSTYS